MINTMEQQINNSLTPVVNQHKAYWKFFFWGTGIAFSVMIYLTVSINNSTTKIVTAVQSLQQLAGQQTLTNKFTENRLDNQRDTMIEVGHRVRNLEIGK